MNLRRATILALAALAMAAGPSLADMTITLRDGRVITVPVQPGEIESVTFGEPAAAPAGTSSAPHPSRARRDSGY
jgi:hypothetical protein